MVFSCYLLQQQLSSSKKRLLTIDNEFTCVYCIWLAVLWFSLKQIQYTQTVCRSRYTIHTLSPRTAHILDANTSRYDGENTMVSVRYTRKQALSLTTSCDTHCYIHISFKCEMFCRPNTQCVARLIHCCTILTCRSILISKM